MWPDTLATTPAKHKPRADVLTNWRFIVVPPKGILVAYVLNQYADVKAERAKAARNAGAIASVMVSRANARREQQGKHTLDYWGNTQTIMLVSADGSNAGCAM